MNDQALRTSLTNFIGALIQNSHLPPEQIKKNIVAILQEECLRISQDSNKICSFDILAPMFKAMIFLLSQRLELLSQEKLDIPAAKQAMHQLFDLAKGLEQLLKSIETIKEDK